MPDRGLRVGQHVGNYRLLRSLGRGGFAQVYLGEHRYLKSAAALKVLQRSLTEKETQSFLAEAQTLVRLRHAHIVRVLDFAVEQGTPVLIMEYVPGGTLRQHHPRGTRLSLSLVVDYVTQIAAALQYAHNQHLIHRDVKPENLLLDAAGWVVLSDFGLALFAPSPDLLSTQELAGTLSYIAPEQVRGKPSFASDQYALGIIVYEWLTGRGPFEGSAWEQIQQHLTAAPPPLREHRPDLPSAVEQVVLKALAKDPRHRYASISAFAQALERACPESRQQGEDSQVTVSLRPHVRSAAPALEASRSNRHMPRTVFLSAAPGDEQVAARLAADLSHRGMVLSNPLSKPVPEQEEALREAMRTASLVVIVATPRTRSSRLVREHLALAQMYQRRLVLVWMQGEEMATLLLDQTWEPFLPVEVVDARAERYQTALDELLACLREDIRVSPYEGTTLTDAFQEPREPRNPYKGLRAFRQEDAADFFGRDALIKEMVEQLKGILATEQPGAAGTRLLTLVGPSGSGKSSVVLAGLLPRLQAGALPGSQNWVYLEPIVPGTHPIEALALTLASHFSDRSVKSIREDLQDDSARGLHWLATQLVKRPDSRVVLVVDQFEELFTQTIAEEERRCFLDLLVTAATEARSPVLVLLTLRADFSDRPMRYPALSRLIEAHRQPVLPMEIHELRAVIEEPAALPDAHLTFEGNLVGDLLFEMQDQVGALPLLEFTLDQLFEHRDGQTLTMAAYQKIGGVKGALVKHAESTYAALPSEEHRHLTRALFLRLIDPGLSEQDTTRRRAALTELALPDARQTAMLQEVADAFIAARLLTTNEVAGTTTIEVSHEALIREWPRLSDWLREGREDISLQQTISEDAAEWKRRGKPHDRLYRGSQLAEATQWKKRNVVSSDEIEFLQSSATRERKARSQRRILVSVISAVLLIMLVVALVLQANLLVAQGNLLASLPVSVTNLNDHGPGSLREAIATAPSGSAITFAKNLRGTIQLTSGELKITRNVVISGPGASALAISGGSTSRVFDINEATVTISNLTIKNSRARINGEGLTGSSSGSGGGLFNHLGSVVLLNSIITGNTADEQGGGIYNLGTLTLIDSTVSNNTSRDSGGGIYDSYTLNLTNSTVSGNISHNRGGGIYNDEYSSMLSLTNTTLSGNKADQQGGGLFNVGGSGAGPIALTYCTVYDNTAVTGGGIVTSHTSAGNTVQGSIVAGNHAITSPDIAGALILSFSNLVQNSTGATFVPSSPFVPPLTGVSPQLGPLRNNGGPTPTHALLAGSPAINQIPPGQPDKYTTICGGFSIYHTDQRGVQRPQGKGCDIGAYEYEPAG